MLFGIILIVILFGLAGLIIWWGIKKETKESQQPLDNDVKNNYFIRAILDITDIIRDFEKEEFLQKEMGNSNKEFTLQYKYGDADIAALYAFGPLGFLLTAGNYNLKNKIEKIESIQNIWGYYLSSQFNKDNFSKEEWKKLDKNIRNKTANLLNSKVLSLTNQKDIKDAWTTILKDKVLTDRVLNKLESQVRKILLPEIRNKER